MPVAGPFYLAMVDETETTFSVEHQRMDEYVFSARRILSEGEKPKLELVIENPRVGLLSAIRKQWCWFAWDSNWGGTPNIIPLFFGRIVGIPTGLQSDTITVTFIAWPSRYKKRLQVVAETLKILPYFDPVFTDVSLRDDPMAIFESHSKMVCVDPVTHAVSASDILDAEDGNEDFTEDDHFYSSLQVSPGAVPKTAVHVDATVSWTQTARGYIAPFVDLTVTSYTGDSIIGEWPKQGATIAPGLTVLGSFAYDSANVDALESESYSVSWTSREKVHQDGDPLSSNVSVTTPIGGTVTSYVSKTGIIDPFAVDGDGDPSPTNIPPSLNVSWKSFYPKKVVASMSLEYQAARPHTERLIFTLFANVQPTTLDPNVSEDSETINISGSDVGMPIVNLLNWTTISGEYVAVGTIIFPDDPQLPGGRTVQICIDDGIAGVESPDFSDVYGEETVDGTVRWASLGVASPTESALDWTKVSNVPTGTIILPRRPLYLDGFPANVDIGEGQYVKGDGVFYVGIGGGDTVQIATIPTGSNFFIATTGGVTDDVIPSFNNTLHDTTVDGTVVWTAIGTGETPVGGVPGNVTGSSYFATDRGKQSIEHLICRARARLRYASRVVSTTFQCSYLRGTELTLRKTATLHDPRLPGGLVLGKIVGTIMEASGGAFTCTVNIASSVGYADAIDAVPGTPTYVEDGYVETGYQLYEDMIIVLPVISDVGYSPIVPIPDEDGITFPLTKQMIVVSESIQGDGYSEEVINAMALVQNHPNEEFLSPEPWLTSDGTLYGKVTNPQKPKDNDRWFELILKPLNGNGVFQHVYHLKCTTLSLPQMINLEEDGDQILPSYVVAGDQFYSPTVANVNNGLAPSYVVDGDQFYSADILGGDHSFSPPYVVDGDQFFSPILENQNRNLAPSYFVGGDQFYSPTVEDDEEWTLAERPFVADSPWNTLVPEDADFTPIDWPAPEGGPINGVPDSGYNYSLWHDSFSVAIYFTDPSYPLVAIAVGNSWNNPAGTVNLRIPIGVTGSPDTDAHLLIIDSDTLEVWDFWIFDRTSNTTATSVGYGHCNILTSDGWGSPDPFLGVGTLAVGASMLGGLLIEAETTDNVISHALGLVCDDVNIRPGYVPPAIGGDGPNPDGIVQEGEWLAIPPGTTMPPGLPPLFQPIFDCLITYGCYVIDKSGGVNGFRFQSNAYAGEDFDELWPYMGQLVPLLQKVN